MHGHCVPLLVGRGRGRRVLVLAQLRFLPAALTTGPSLTVVPIFHSAMIVFSIIGGGVLFQELAAMSGVEIGLFVVGLVILLMGLWILSNRKLEYPRKPSRFYLAGILARFVARLRATLRRKEAAAWPNRLHLYTCDCGCHAPVLRGERPALRLLADGGAAFGLASYRVVEEVMGRGSGAGGRARAALATIRDADDEDADVPDDDLRRAAVSWARSGTGAGRAATLGACWPPAGGPSSSGRGPWAPRGTRPRRRGA